MIKSLFKALYKNITASRNGIDDLLKFQFYFLILLVILDIFLDSYIVGFLQLITMISIGIRFMSKNLYRRVKENQIFNNIRYGMISPFKNIIRRNNVRYLDDCSEILIGGLSSISYYKDKEVTLVSDHSLNVNNHVSAGLLSSLGVDRITLSSELNQHQISNLISNYVSTYNTSPNLEMIVYGRATLMHSKYCPLRKLDMCGSCKTSNFALKDDFETFPIRFNDDCTINLLNSKTLNLLDEIPNISGVNYFRLVFTTESPEEVENIINIALKKLSGESSLKCFDGKSQTRGNFKKQLL